MIGWKPKPFIFVHIPKCAGTSIETAFVPILSRHKDFNGDFLGLSEEVKEELSQFWLPGKINLQHSKLKKYEQHFKLNDYFKFAFVRNPWDRAVSQIGYLRSHTGKSLFSGDSFKENLQIYCNTNKNVWAHDLGACQLDYLQNRSGEVCVDFIGRFESLVDDFRKICEVIGVEVPSLPHVFNTKRPQHYSAYYDDESAGWIRDRFAKDIGFFGYEFERVQETNRSTTVPCLFHCPRGASRQEFHQVISHFFLNES